MQAKPYVLGTKQLISFPTKENISRLSLEIAPRIQSVLIIDIDGNILYINREFSETSGYSPEEAIKLNFKNIVSEKIEGFTYVNLWNTIISGKEWRDNLHFKNCNGDIELSKTIISPVKSRAGEITHFIITRNVVKEKSEQAKKINNLVRYGYFGNLSCSLMHELKSHFALIKMNFNLLQPAAESEKKVYSIIDRDLERVNKLFNNFSQLSKDKELEFIDLNIKDVIEYSFSYAKQLQYNKRISFINNVESCVIKGDYQKLKCLFKNLIDNSIDAIEESGEIKTWSKREDGFLLIYFKDNGCGIRKKDKLFEPFNTTKANGTGLGLAIVKKIIEEHNGKINLLKSKKGNTVFEIKYPYKHQ